LFGQTTMPATAAEATKHTSTAVASGMIKALGVSNVDRMASAAEELMPGGRALIEDALAVGAGNKRNEVMLDMQINDGMMDGRVPVVDGSTPGTHLTPYNAVHAVLKRSPFQRDIGKHTELLTERDKPFLYASGRSAEQVQMDTYRKMAEITGRTVDDVAKVLGKIDEGMAQAVHAAYYYHKGYSLHRKVITALKAMPVNTLPTWLRGKGFVDRLTQVGARTLTNLRAKELRALVTAKDYTLLRDKVAGFREFDNLTNDIADADLLAYVDEWLTKHEGTLLTEVPLHLPDGRLDPSLPPELREWAENSGDLGYRLALAPPDDLPGQVLYRESRNKDGVLNGMSPWMPFEAERLEDVSLPGRWERLHMQALSGIRQERINWTNRRRFVTEMATGSQRGGVDIPPGLAQRMFDAIMVRASESNVQPRGLSPSSIVQAARSVLRDKEYQGAMRGVSVSDTQLLMVTLKAFRGDLAQVGVTQAFTGSAKVRLPGAGRNMWGQIAENLYPLMRFSVNPVFLTMELVEPYVLGAMRGITVPLRKSGERYQEAVATHESVERLLRSGLNPEGSQMEQAEKLSLMRDVTVFANNRYGKTSRMGKFFDRIAPGDIQRRKSAAMSLQTEKTFGRMMKESMQSIMGDEFNPFWRGLQDSYQTVDDGEIAMKWALENLAFTDSNGTRITSAAQLLNPANLGQRARFALTETPGAMTYRDVADTLDASIRTRSATKNMRATFGEMAEAANAARTAGATPLHAGDILYEEIRSGRMTRADVHALFNDLSMHNGAGGNSNAEQLWLHATGMTSEELKTGWRMFTGTIRGATAAESRVLRDQAIERNMALIRARAMSAGMTEDEWVRLHFQKEGLVRERALKPGQTPVARAGTVADPLFDQRDGWLQTATQPFADAVNNDTTPESIFPPTTAPETLARFSEPDAGEYMYMTMPKTRAARMAEGGISPDYFDYMYSAETFADPGRNPHTSTSGVIGPAATTPEIDAAALELSNVYEALASGKGMADDFTTTTGEVKQIQDLIGELGAAVAAAQQQGKVPIPGGIPSALLSTKEMLDAPSPFDLLSTPGLEALADDIEPGVLPTTYDDVADYSDELPDGFVEDTYTPGSYADKDTPPDGWDDWDDDYDEPFSSWEEEEEGLAVYMQKSADEIAALNKAIADTDAELKAMYPEVATKAASDYDLAVGVGLKPKLDKDSFISQTLADHHDEIETPISDYFEDTAAAAPPPKMGPTLKTLVASADHEVHAQEIQSAYILGKDAGMKGDTSWPSNWEDYASESGEEYVGLVQTAYQQGQKAGQAVPGIDSITPGQALGMGMKTGMQGNGHAYVRIAKKAAPGDVDLDWEHAHKHGDDYDEPDYQIRGIGPDTQVEVLTKEGWKPLREAIPVKGTFPVPPKEFIDLLADPSDVESELMLHGGRAYPPAINEYDAEYLMHRTEKDVSKFWEGAGYAEINTYLRGHQHAQGITMTSSMTQERVAHLDVLVRRSMLPKPTTLWRGVNVSRAVHEFKNADARVILGHNEGDVISDKGYLAHSLDDWRGKQFAERTGYAAGTEAEPHQGVIFEFRAPAGMRVHNIGGWETEHLIARDKPFKILKKTVTKYAPGVESGFGGKHERGNTNHWREITHYVVVEDGPGPHSAGTLPGVHRITMEEATLDEALIVQAEATAAKNPAHM